MKNYNKYLNKVIIGLADGYVEKTGKNCRLSFSFGADYFDYANWMNNLFIDYCSNSVYSVKVTTKGKEYVNYRLKTRTLSVFNEYRDMFYKIDEGRYKKVVSSDIYKEMCPIVLAHLIMGDGNFSNKDKRIRIYTNSFTFEECTILAKAITNNCDIECKVLFDRVGHNKQKQYILTIGKKQQDKLKNLVSPHMHKSMLYRVGL